MPAPVLAAPLVIPFAEAIGVSIAALGMAKATDKVNEFIQENPEQSIKIFQMIMPSQGIANALKNKSSEGDEEVSEDIDVEVEEKPKLTGKEKSEKIKAAIRRARAGKGNYSSPDAEGSAVDIRGSVIREAEDMGLADKDLKDKPYKEKGYDFRDYIPRGAYKKKYADGGAIGIEVLFGPKVPAAPSQLVEESEIVLGYRGPGGYQGGSSSRSSSSSSSTNQGPAGGASAGGNYGGNRNPSQTYGGSVFSGGGGNQNAKPPKTKTPNFVNNLKNVYGIVSPFINPASNIGKVKTIFDTYNLYKNPPFIEKDMTLGMTPQVPTNMQVAELSQKQLDFLNSPKIQRDLKEFGRDPKAVFDMLPNYEEKPFFGTNQEPTTPQEYNEYLDSIGVPRMTAADGGRVGLFMGGPALEGPALGIYNSMKAYNSFTDQEIANAIKEAGYELPTSSTPPPGDSTPGSSQPSGNNDRSVALPIGSVTGSGLIGDYMAATQDRQNRLTNPNKVQSFINNFTGGGQADIGEMIRTGQVDTRKTSGIPLGIGPLLSQILPDKYYDMSLGDQVFTQSQMGYTGPTVFGENPTGNYKDPFGLNVRSGLGNYAEAVGKNFDQLRGTLTKDRKGVTFNEETGLFEGVNADAVNKQTEMIRNKFNFRKQQLGVKNVLDSKIKAADTQREKDYAAALEKARLERIAKQQIADAEKAARQRAQEEAIARDIARDMQESNRAR
jgi:hypothetical protein